jgi:tetratricopeptide (TPR) repeat protein
MPEACRRAAALERRGEMFGILRLRHLQALLLGVLLAAGCKEIGAVPQPQVPMKSPEQEEKAQAASFAALYESGITSLRAGQAGRAIESLTKAVRINPGNKAARCALGQAFINGGQPVESIEQFQKCVEFDSGDIQSQYNLGQAYLRLALTTADRLLEGNDTSSYARRIFAENYIGRSDFAEAETQYQLALQTEPEARDLRLALGDLYLRMGKPARAREEFQKILDGVPSSLAARRRLAEVDFLQGDFASALTQLRFVVGLNPGFLRLRADFPQLSPPGLSLDDLCSRFSKFASTAPEDPALAFLQNACRRNLSRKILSPGTVSSSDQPPLASVPQGDEQGLTARELCWAGLCEACGDRLRGTLAGRSPDTEVLSEVGQCDYNAGDYESAFGHFLEAQERNPRDLESLYWLQESARRLAAQCFERVKQIHPDSYLVHLLNARSWEEQQQPGRAMQEYRAAIARRPDAVNVRVLLGHLQWKWQEYDDALPQLNEALRLDPTDPIANYLVGDIWVQEHHPEKALPYLNKAISLQPSFLNAKASHARALSQLGRVQEALGELQAVASADQDGSIHYQLYQICLKLGRNAEAQAALAVSEKIRSQHRGARELPSPHAFF